MSSARPAFPKRFWKENRPVDGENLSLIVEFPCVERFPAAHGDSGAIFKGKIEAGNRDYAVEVVRGADGQCRHSTDLGIDVPPLRGVVNFLRETRKLLEAADHKPKTVPVEVYRKVINEYNEFTTFADVKRCKLANNLSEISIGIVDDGNREHCMTVRVDFQDKIAFWPDAELPVEIESGNNLLDIYTKFKGAVQGLQNFFCVMDALDSSASVLDPETPTRKHRHRRIWLDQNSSVVVTLDPNDVRTRPDLVFLGPERIVAQYRARLNETLEVWDDFDGVIPGLLHVLNIEQFPIREAQMDNAGLLMEEGECAICFCPRRFDRLPEIVCENKSCETFYHVHCLYEWLTSSNSKRIFNRIQGVCPNCEKTISCIPPDEPLQ